MQLRKVCNHPSFVETDISSIPEEFLKGTYEDQGTKLAVVSFILQELHSRSDEKIVLVSISTQVLDLFEELCQHYSYSFLRLDGSTSQNQRQSVVNRFNSPHGKDLVLLLSSKAGGTGGMYIRHTHYAGRKEYEASIFRSESGWCFADFTL